MFHIYVLLENKNIYGRHVNPELSDNNCFQIQPTSSYMKSEERGVFAAWMLFTAIFTQIALQWVFSYFSLLLIKLSIWEPFQVKVERSADARAIVTQGKNATARVEEQGRREGIKLLWFMCFSEAAEFTSLIIYEA